MLELKSAVASHPKFPRPSSAGISDLPQEVRDLILDHLYCTTGRRLDSILPSSKVCRHFRLSALPLLFESVSISIRDQTNHLPHQPFAKLVSQPHLLKHIKTLSVQRPLNIRDDRDWCDDVTGQENHVADITLLEHALDQMPQVCQVRLCCTLTTTVSVLRILRSRKDIRIIIDRTLPEGALSRDSSVADLLSEDIYRHLRHDTFQLALNPSETSEDEQHAVQFHAIIVGSYRPRLSVRFGALVNNLKQIPLECSLASLEELWLGPRFFPAFTDFIAQVPWHQLRRLSVRSRDIQSCMYKLAPNLPLLRDLRLIAVDVQDFHINCPYDERANTVHSDVNHPYLEIDFVSLRSLQTLEIEGICNHVPIRSLVSPNLKALKLHRPHARSSVASLESQRSPSDLIAAAKIAPNLEQLALDIGYIENMWHPTAIAGVHVDAALYHFISALRNYKYLKRLHLYPPYVPKEELQNHPEHLWNHCQPASDALIVRLFGEVNSLCPALEALIVSVSDMQVPSWQDFSPMNWEAWSWGDKTMLTTRQSGKPYELRQVWTGQRRLTIETKRDAYSQQGFYRTDDWILH